MKKFNSWLEAFEFYSKTMFGDQSEACADHVSYLIQEGEIEVISHTKSTTYESLTPQGSPKRNPLIINHLQLFPSTVRPHTLTVRITPTQKSHPTKGGLLIKPDY
jgi:hypothetical protein